MEITVIENERRKKEIDRPYRPETGEGSITGKAFLLSSSGCSYSDTIYPGNDAGRGRARKTFTSAWFDRKIYSERVEIRIPLHPLLRKKSGDGG